MITVHNETTKNPISLIGEMAGTCWGADTTVAKKNYKRGINCLTSGHGRTWEYPQVYITIDGYSARVIRELYTHIAGGPTRLQASTRYIQYGDFGFIVPPTIENNERAKEAYLDAINQIKVSFREMEDAGVPKEDIANILPLGMTSKVVLRTNTRNLIDMSHQRLCTRAYWEFRKLMNDIMKALSEYSDEWKYIIDNYFKPKCEVCGFCIEDKSCGRKPKNS